MGARFREGERCGEEEAGLVVVVVDWWWWWVIGRRCDGDNVLLVPDETTWMDGRLDIIRGRHAVGPTCSLLWREHVRTFSRAQWKMVRASPLDWNKLSHFPTTNNKKKIEDKNQAPIDFLLKSLIFFLN